MSDDIWRTAITRQLERTDVRFAGQLNRARAHRGSSVALAACLRNEGLRL